MISAKDGAARLTIEPGGPVPDRNPGSPLDLGWVMELRANSSAVERHLANLGARRTLTDEWRNAWLLRAVSCLDLTTLAGDDTPGVVRRLSARGRRPLPSDLLAGLGATDLDLRVGAICVYHAFVETAVNALAGSGIPVAAVSAGFPAGLSPFAQRVAEISASVDAGATEIDIVVTRAHILTGNWTALYDEVSAFREACGAARMKAILSTGELGTLRNVARASIVCMMAGADFIKTSTGKETTNATLQVGLVMARAIRDYHERTGYRVGFKPAGGIRTASQALEWLVLMKEELGDRWLSPTLFRFGASGLLDDIERRLAEYAAPGDRPTLPGRRYE
jgi:deoxyribose-phosphate aldolase